MLKSRIQSSKRPISQRARTLHSLAPSPLNLTPTADMPPKITRDANKKLCVQLIKMILSFHLVSARLCTEPQCQYPYHGTSNSEHRTHYHSGKRTITYEGCLILFQTVCFFWNRVIQVNQLRFTDDRMERCLVPASARGMQDLTGFWSAKCVNERIIHPRTALSGRISNLKSLSR